MHPWSIDGPGFKTQVQLSDNGQSLIETDFFIHADPTARIRKGKIDPIHIKETQTLY
jgi:hypothetical protein